MSGKRERLRRKADGVRLREVREQRRVDAAIAEHGRIMEQAKVDAEVRRWRGKATCWFPDLGETAQWLDDAAEEARA